MCTPGLEPFGSGVKGRLDDVVRAVAREREVQRGSGRTQSQLRAPGSKQGGDFALGSRSCSARALIRVGTIW